MKVEIPKETVDTFNRIAHLTECATIEEFIQREVKNHEQAFQEAMDEEIGEIGDGLMITHVNGNAEIIMAIKTIRQHLHCSLRDAKEMVDAATGRFALHGVPYKIRGDQVGVGTPCDWGVLSKELTELGFEAQPLNSSPSSIAKIRARYGL